MSAVCVYVQKGEEEKINRFNLVLKFNYLINKMLERLLLLQLKAHKRNEQAFIKICISHYTAVVCKYGKCSE